MQEITFKANREAGLKLQKKTFKSYRSFKTGLGLSLAAAGGFVFDIANMVDWILYGCGPLNILIHVVMAAVLVGLWVGAFKILFSGGKRYLKRPAEEVRLYGDHLSVGYIPYKQKKGEHVLLNIYYCDIQEMRYDQKKRRIEILSASQIKRTSLNKNGEKETQIEEPESGSYYVYAWYEDFGALKDKL